MKKENFERLRTSFQQAVEHAEGKRELRTTALIKIAPMNKDEVKNLRDTLNVSQAVFANYLNVSPSLVRSMEQGITVPTGSTLRLLRIAEKNPKILIEV